MKKLLCTLILATLGTVAAKADSVSITFDPSNQFAVAGETLQVFGTITNTSNTTIFLNSDTITLNGLSFTIDDLFFNTPLSLAPEGQAGSSSGDIELFDITVSNPLLDAMGTYTGTYTLVGGIDGDAQDNLGTGSFSVSTVPEPGSLYLLLTGISATLVPVTRRLRSK